MAIARQTEIVDLGNGQMYIREAEPSNKIATMCEFFEGPVWDEAADELSDKVEYTFYPNEGKAFRYINFVFWSSIEDVLPSEKVLYIQVAV